MADDAMAKKVGPDRTDMYTDIWYKLTFGVYGDYWVKVTVREYEEIPEDHFIFEMETMHEPCSFRARINSPDGPGSNYYGLTSEVRFCQLIADAQESGYCNHESLELSNLNWSDELPILIDEHWAQVVSADYALLRFGLVMKSTEGGAPALEPCADYSEVTAQGSQDPVEIPHALYYPIPEDDKGRKQLRKKKVKVIWKKDM